MKKTKIAMVVQTIIAQTQSNSGISDYPPWGPELKIATSGNNNEETSTIRYLDNGRLRIGGVGNI